MSQKIAEFTITIYENRFIASRDGQTFAISGASSDLIRAFNAIWDACPGEGKFHREIVFKELPDRCVPDDVLRAEDEEAKKERP